jgi:two-component system response regulator MprA
MKPRVLVVDDDPKVLSALARGLALEGYEVETADDGPGAVALARAREPDVVVLDVMLPGVSGLEVCDRLRRTSAAPILLLTARDSVQDRVAGLDRGADDYLVKPFAFDELLARLRALLRRGPPAQPYEILRYADLQLSPATREAWRAGAPLSLTAREFDLLEFLLRHPRQVIARTRLLEQVWHYDYLGGSNVIDVHVRALRDKLEAGGQPRLIQTIRGVGYALREA